MNAQYQAIYQIIKTGHWITDCVNRELKELGTTEPQFNVLRILRGRKGEPATVQSIQDDMVQRTSNVTRIIDKLIDKGLVNRVLCPSNRRKVDITITAKGLDELKRYDKRVQALHAPMVGNLTAEEANTLTTLIKKFKGEK